MRFYGIKLSNNYLHLLAESCDLYCPRTNRQVDPSPLHTPQLSSFAVLPSWWSQPTICQQKEKGIKRPVDYDMDEVTCLTQIFIWADIISRAVCKENDFARANKNTVWFYGKLQVSLHWFLGKHYQMQRQCTVKQIWMQIKGWIHSTAVHSQWTINVALSWRLF